MRVDSLRHLHLAAQFGETLFFMMRLLAAAMGASPAPLRPSLAPTQRGLNLRIVRRQGPVRDEPVLLPMQVAPVRHIAPQHRPAKVPASTPVLAAHRAMAELR
jgi:protein ImuA